MTEYYTESLADKGIGIHKKDELDIGTYKDEDNLLGGLEDSKMGNQGGTCKICGSYYDILNEDGTCGMCRVEEDNLLGNWEEDFDKAFSSEGIKEQEVFRLKCENKKLQERVDFLKEYCHELEDSVRSFKTVLKNIVGDI